MDFYSNYLLDDLYVWQLTSLDKLRLDEAIWLVDTKCSIRTVTREFNRSKSTIWRDLHRVKKLSYELYCSVRKILISNKF